MITLGSLILAYSFAAVRNHGLVQRQNEIKPLALEKVENPPVIVTSAGVLKVVSSKSSFNLAGPVGTAFQFQPSVPKESGFQTASLQVNGVEVAVGQFKNGLAPALGYAPTSPVEVAVYRGIAPGKAQVLAIYRLRTDGSGLHPLKLRTDGVLLTSDKPQGSYLIFGPIGCLGLTTQRQFSADLSAFPSGPADFASVYVNGDSAEAPVVLHCMLKPRIGIEGLDQPVSSAAPVSVQISDPSHRGIRSVQFVMNGRDLGTFGIDTPIALDLSTIRPGMYTLNIFGKLANGTKIGPESRNLEITNEARRQRPDQTPAPTIRDIIIRSAWYGAPGGPGADVTQKVLGLLAASGGTIVEARNNDLGDPASGQHKQLTIEYNLRGKVGRVTCEEEGKIDFMDLLLENGGRGPDRLRVTSAIYQGVDVTAKVREAVARGETSIPVESYWLGVQDPAPNVRKTLVITLTNPDMTTRVVTGTDGERVSLSESPTLTNQLLDSLQNGSFDSLDTAPLASEMKYVLAGNGVLGQSGVYTLAYGVMRPFQLHPALRLDFYQRSDNPNSMAMFINPVPGRQPIVLWSERVKVQPNTDYKFQCYCADVSDNDENAWASIALQADSSRSKELLLDTGDVWKKITFTFRTGAKPEITLRIWRDVLPPWANSGSLIALDDITLVQLSGKN